jgi:lactate permease
MPWKQVFDPFHHIGWSALVAAVPVFFIFWALLVQKMRGWVASLWIVVLVLAIAIFVYGMPLSLSLLSAADGALYGVFTICWIIVGAIFLYNITVAGGQFLIIRQFMARITDDRRLQALLIAFSFGAFLEGAAGFGSPVAITAAMLAGLGFNPLYAAGICLIANTAPVAFGSIGIPVTVAAQVSGLPEMALSQMIGRTLPFISLIVPFYLVCLMCGWRKTMEVMPAILVSGISFALTQFITANYLSPMLPDVISGLVSIISLMVLLRYWKPRQSWRFPEETPVSASEDEQHSNAAIARAWLPYLIMTVMVVGWGLQPVKDYLNSIGQVKFYVPGLAHSIVRPDGSELLIKPFTFNYLSNAGSAILLAGLLSIPLTGISLRKAVIAVKLTLHQLKAPVITIAAVVAFAFVANNSGISSTMALALAATGAWFPFFSPVLGWLGVFLTGSDTSSNALFGKLQLTTAQRIGVDPLITVAANASGGVTAKMISPQSIAVGVAAVGLTGQESRLFAFTVRHSFILLLITCVFAVLQAYVFKWMVPQYMIPALALPASTVSLTTGKQYLLIVIMAVAVIALVVGVLHAVRKRGGRFTTGN